MTEPNFNSTMKTSISNLSLPDSPSDYTVLPFATPRIEPGNYRLRIVIRARSAIDAAQAFLKSTFGMAGGPILSASSLIQITHGGSTGLNYNGSLAVQTTNPPNEMSLDPCDHEILHHTTGEITVSAAGYLSLAFAGEAGWTLVECVIDVEPI